MRRKLSMAIAIFIFLLGASFVAYPYVSDFVYKQAQSRVTWAQSEAIGALEEEDLTAYKQAALDYNARLLSGKTVVTDPFDPSQQQVTKEEYNALMNVVGDGVMGSVSIPAIGISKTPIYHGTSDEVLEKGAGHLESTSLPFGGESAHSVMAGHTGLPSVKIFDGLDKLEVGDYFVLTVLGEDHAYRIYSIETVLPEETESLVIEPGRDLCTLVTCTPYGVNTHRLLVHAERCEVPQEWIDLQNQQTLPIPAINGSQELGLFAFSLIGLAVALGVLLGVRVLRSRKRAEGKQGGEAPGQAGKGSGSGRHLG